MTGNRGKAEKPLLVIVTGLSGAGRSSAISSFEDMGFLTIDNLPFELLASAVEYMSVRHQAGQHLFAVGMEIRNVEFMTCLSEFRGDRSDGFTIDHVHLTADDEVIAIRYGATRRKHPQIDVGGELLGAIKRERELVARVEERADMTMDTSHWSPQQLSRALERRYAGEVGGRQLFVSVTSFGFKNGMLRPADSLCDVRFLSNPHFVPELRDLSGQDEPVLNYLEKVPDYAAYLQKLTDMYGFLLPLYYDEGKHYFRIGIGCTGGKHRSVAVANYLVKCLSALEFPNVVITVNHRDL